MSSLTELVVLLAVLSISTAKFDDSIISEDIRKLLKGLHDVCVSKTAVDEVLIEKLKDAEFTEDQKLKCYVQCLLVQTGSMDLAGHIDIEAAVELIPEQIRNAVIKDVNKCAKDSEQVAEHCDRAFATLKCLYSVNPDIYYVF
ncbi:hypothetical protein GWI33_022194 [Rhynchophorus ferrugineus]|uniref:Odorant binding protein n=1 Tax=Rhynchophorus ferrugineus TaxID=354439 RepID=A0A834IV04_RHYFE|nr:hypothetical protein GWI33_022194 [Rhynchophorus ferrugineus]